MICVFSIVAEHIVTDCPQYRWTLEEHRNHKDQQMMFIHLEVREWSKSTLKAMLNAWTEFRKIVKCPLFATAEVDDKKFEHFARLFGLTPIQEVVCENGEQRRLYMHLII